ISAPQEQMSMQAELNTSTSRMEWEDMVETAAALMVVLVGLFVLHAATSNPCPRRSLPCSVVVSVMVSAGSRNTAGVAFYNGIIAAASAGTAAPVMIGAALPASGWGDAPAGIVAATSNLPPSAVGTA